MNNINVNLENLTDKERDTLLSLVEKANTTSERWKPKEEDVYYYLDDKGSVQKESVHKWELDWCGWSDSSLRYKVGNVFKTEKEAYKEACKEIYTTMLEDFARKHNGESTDWKYYLAANKNENGEYYVEFIISRPAREYPMPAFNSIDVAKEAVKVIGEENLLKYYFQVI